MIESRLFQVLDVLSEQRIRKIDLSLSIQEPEDSPHLKLWNFIKDMLIHKSSRNSKQQAFRYVYKDQNYKDQKLRLLTSQLFKEIAKSSFAKSRVLLKFYREQGLQKHYTTQEKKTRLNFNGSKVKDATQLDEQIEFESISYDYLLEQKRNQDLNLQRILDLTDLAYFAKKLKHICNALAHESVYQIKYDLGFITHIEDHLTEELLEEHPAVALYYSCYKMLQNPEDKAMFENYILNIHRYEHFFSNEEIRNIYLLGINICIKRLNKGNKEFGKIGIDLYEKGLTKKYLLVNNKITRYTYRNIAMMAIRIGDFEWAENFTEHYKEFLRALDKTSSYHFNKALISYNKGELDAALDNIIEADFSDHLINLAAKTLQAKIYYELRQVDLLDSHLDSMEMYIIRKKVLGYYKENYRNIISYLRKMLRLRDFDTEKKIRLKEKLDKENVLTERSWFLKQLV